MLHGFVKDYRGFVGEWSNFLWHYTGMRIMSNVAVRVLLGLFEGGLYPGVVYYLTLWYPRHRLQYRIGLFFGAATIAYDICYYKSVL